MTFEFDTPCLKALLKATPPSTDLRDVFDGGEDQDPDLVKRSRKEVGARVQELREILGSSREDFDKFSERDVPYLQSVETGHWRLVPETATLIAMRTGVDAGSLGGYGDLLNWKGEKFSRATADEWQEKCRELEGGPPEGDASQARARLKQRVDALSKDNDMGWKTAGFLAAFLATPTPRIPTWRSWPGNPEPDWPESNDASALRDSPTTPDPRKEQLRRGAENLKVIRVRARMTLKELSEATGGTTTLGKIETSRVPLLAHVATRIGVRVGADPASLIAEDYPAEWGNYSRTSSYGPRPYGFRSFERWEEMLKNARLGPETYCMGLLDDVQKKLQQIPLKDAWISQFIAAYLNTEPLRQWGRQSANGSKEEERTR